MMEQQEKQQFAEKFIEVYLVHGFGLHRSLHACVVRCLV